MSRETVIGIDQGPDKALQEGCPVVARGLEYVILNEQVALPVSVPNDRLPVDKLPILSLY
jgi:hypothetical protein